MNNPWIQIQLIPFRNLPRPTPKMVIISQHTLPISTFVPSPTTQNICRQSNHYHIQHHKPHKLTNLQISHNGPTSTSTSLNAHSSTTQISQS